ncbi:uncharacterized protein N7443_003099 [Penicillium atrosanguineum]|uniref:Uncharacterized protein n=1 Tax=Penicillium atrosanguineum TaxID=1132637 RepID=A0A9W9U4J1_9EURO|nr:uncharacterized protein N7443_003099 [Penicillium atrosanguineum]KAJ5310638.1 hypothetical protein N7443_003099 [Penicillium atrosanguineum]KAJ5316161.1 hypothetical protein N7476_006468 [Penicillium atrosanguineum]
MKVVVASPSRSGTLGLYRAMQILGYKAYHMFECVIVRGKDHMEICEEAVVAQNNRFSGIKRYDRVDFDKWFADYNCLVEIPSFVGPAIIEAYVEEPDVKFILVEREPTKWVTSLNNSGGKLIKTLHGFPLVFLKYFDVVLYRFITLNQTCFWSFSDGNNPNDPDFEVALHRNYAEYIEMVKRTVPADRILHIKLENGLGWEQICPFLGVPFPKEDYPDRNQPERFQAIAQDFLQPRITAAIARFAFVAVPSLGVIGWAAIKYGPSLVKAMGRNI